MGGEEVEEVKATHGFCQPALNIAKCAKNGNIWPKMTKNADFGPNLAVFGPKILIFMGVSKSFGTNITENHLDNLSALFLEASCYEQIRVLC